MGGRSLLDLVSFPRVDLRFLASSLFSAHPVQARHWLYPNFVDLALALAAPGPPRVEQISVSVVSFALAAPLLG